MRILLVAFLCGALSSCLLFDDSGNNNKPYQGKYDQVPVAHDETIQARLLSDRGQIFKRLKSDSALVNGVMQDSLYLGGKYVDSVDIDSLEVVYVPTTDYVGLIASIRQTVAACDTSWQYTASEIEYFKGNLAQLESFYASIQIGQRYGLGYYNMISEIATVQHFCKNSSSILAETYNLLLNEYLYSEDIKPFTTYTSVEELFASLSDHYTAYTKPTPDVTEQQTQYLAPIVSGIIGITFYDMKDTILKSDTLVITAVYPKSPAEDAGLKANDRILKVNDSVVVQTGDNSERFKAFSPGGEGTAVKLEVKRGEAVLIFTAIKGSVRVPTVWVDSIEGLGLIKIDRFSSETYEKEGTKAEFIAALKATAHFPKTIIDLRNNGGGVVSQCTEMADELIAGGVMYQEKYMDRGTKYHERVTATAGGIGESRSFYYLANGGSASCTEILLIAVKENRSDLIIGDTTYGKGIGQGIHLIDNGKGGTVKVTSLEFYGKNGTVYQTVGIPPHIQITPREDALEVAINHYKGTLTGGKKESIHSYDLDRVYGVSEYILPSEPFLIDDRNQ